MLNTATSSSGTGRRLLSLLALFALAVTASAQEVPYSVASLAGGGAGPSSARDQGALFLNPANLVYDDHGGRIVMSLFPVRVSGGGSLLQVGFYNDERTGRTISEAEKRALIEDWFGPEERNSLRYVSLAGGVVPVAMVVRGGDWGMGFAAQVRSHNRLGVNRGLVDLALFGLEEERSVPIDAEIESMNTVHLSLALSRRFPDRHLSIGIAPRLILGTSYAAGQMNSVLDLREDAIVHRFDYTVRAAGDFSHDVLDRFATFGGPDSTGRPIRNPFGAVAGRGAGLDLGATYEIATHLDAAVSITDLGFVTWSADAQEVTPTNSEFRFEGVELDMSRIDQEFDGSSGAYVSHVIDSLAKDVYRTVERSDAHFTTSTAAALHASGTFYFANRLGALTAGTSVPMNRAAGNLTRRPSVYLGTEYRLGRRYGMPLRAGLRAGGAGAISTAAGIGFYTPFWEFAVSAAATPSSEAAGNGMRFGVGFSLLTLRFGR